MKVYLDTESEGLVGETRMVQYAFDDGPVRLLPLFRGWEANSAVREELFRLWALLDLPSTVLVGFNLPHDLLHILRLFHRLKGFAYDSPERPVAPLKCQILDLQIWAIKGSPLSPFAFSKGASRSVAAVRRIPRVTADLVRETVERRLRPLLPAVCELKSSEHEVPGKPHLVTLSWHTDTRLSLKNLMKVYGLPTIALAEVWPLPEKGTEKTWLPYPQEIHASLTPLCEAILSDPSLPFHSYARLDIEFTRVLEAKLGYPQPDHNDACAHAVGYTTYYGFGLDRKVLERTRDAYAARVAKAQAALAGTDLASPKQRLALLRQTDPLVASSSRKVIEVLANSDRPSAPAARAMIDFGMFQQRLNQVEKVLECRTGRAHPSFRVMGARTGRMAGSAGINWQGIPQAKNGLGIRAAMETAAGGDFAQFEVCIAAAAFPDAAIQEDIDQGIDQHSMNAVLMHPQVRAKKLDYPTFSKMVKSKDAWAADIRKKMKPITFGIFYMCQAAKVAETLGVPLHEGEAALDRYYNHYRGFAAYKHELERQVQTADTDHWRREALDRFRDTMEDMTGFKMTWRFEADVARALWQLGCEGIRTGRDGMVTRTPEKGPQTFDGAVKSALLGSSIAIQAAMTRQIGNAKVQATGSTLCKMLTADVWNSLRVPCAVIHDEIQWARHPNYDHEKVLSVINSFIQKWSKVVPSLRFDFGATSVWADK